MQVRKRIYEILEVASPGDRASRMTDLFILGLIVLNVAALILETVPAIDRQFGQFFAWFELVSVAIFSLEYLLRLWCSVEHPAQGAALAGRLRFVRSPVALIDLMAVLPFYLGLLTAGGGVDARFLRTFRLARIFRVAKLVRYSAALGLFRRVLMQKRAELLVMLFVISVLLIFASCLIYEAEHDANPQFSSIPAAMWWGIITLTTVGYGDSSPVTAWGKLLAALIAVLGILMFALPTSVLGAAFLDEMRRSRETAQTCPHCGKALPE